jgi:TonB family protein
MRRSYVNVFLAGSAIAAAGLVVVYFQRDLVHWRWTAPATPIQQGSEDKPLPDSRATLPVFEHRVRPAIPDTIRPATAPASVTVRVEIDESGLVSEVVVVESGLPAADAYIVAACRQWRFKPTGRKQELIFHQLIGPPDVRRRQPASTRQPTGTAKGRHTRPYDPRAALSSCDLNSAYPAIRAFANGPLSDDAPARAHLPVTSPQHASARGSSKSPRRTVLDDDARSQPAGPS